MNSKRFDNWFLAGAIAFGACVTVFSLQPQSNHITVPTRTVIDWRGTVAISTTTESLVARDHFLVHSENDGTTWFESKIEQPFRGSVLRYGRLSGSVPNKMDDCSIIVALGGEAEAETTLTELSSLMEAQKNGESGPLLTGEGDENIFYIRDTNGVFRTVFASWNDGSHTTFVRQWRNTRGWHVAAAGSTGACAGSGWFTGAQIFARNNH